MTARTYSKTCVKRLLSKRQKNGFQDQLSLNAGQKYYRMLQREHSAILSTFIKLPFVIKIFVLSIFEWLFYTGFTVYISQGIPDRFWQCVTQYPASGKTMLATDCAMPTGHSKISKLKVCRCYNIFQEHRISQLDDLFHISLEFIWLLSNDQDIMLVFQKHRISQLDDLFLSSLEFLWLLPNDQVIMLVFQKHRISQLGLFVFVALCPMSTAMVIAGRSIHLTTLFLFHSSL